MARRKADSQTERAIRGTAWGKKRVFSTHITESLLEEARDYVVALSGPPHHLTLSALVERALGRELSYLKRTRNRGRKFAKRTHELRTGRPIARS